MPPFRRKPPPLSPRQRYAAQLRLGLSKDAALSSLAIHYGLAVNVVRLAPDGKTLPDVKWSLREIEHLVALKWAYENGRLH